MTMLLCGGDHPLPLPNRKRAAKHGEARVERARHLPGEEQDQGCLHGFAWRFSARWCASGITFGGQPSQWSEGYGAECAKWSAVYVCVCIYLIAFLTSLCFGVCCSGLRGDGWWHTCSGWWVEMTGCLVLLLLLLLLSHRVLFFAGTTHVGGIRCRIAGATDSSSWDRVRRCQIIIAITSTRGEPDTWVFYLRQRRTACSCEVIARPGVSYCILCIDYEDLRGASRKHHTKTPTSTRSV